MVSIEIITELETKRSPKDLYPSSLAILKISYDEL